MAARLLALVAAAALLSCTPAWKKALGDRPDRPARFSTFRSGLRLVVFQDPTPDRFELAVVYGVGAVADPQGREGLADLARRLSQRTPSGDMQRVDRLLAAGAQVWSETGLDAMAFRARGPMQALDTALAVEAERLVRPVDVADPAVLETAAMEVALDAPGAGGARSQLALLAEAVLAGHPYARPLFGTPSSVRSLGLEEARRFAGEHLVPANAVLVLASGEEPEAAARRVRERLSAAGAAGAQEAVAPAPWATAPPLPLPASEPALRTLRAGSTARLWLGWALPGTRGAKAFPGIIALLEVERRLQRRLRERDLSQRVRAVEVESLPGALAGVAYARIDLTSAEDAGPVIEAAAGALRASPTRGALSDLSELSTFLAEHAEAMPDPDLTAVAQLVRAGYGPDYVETFRTRITGEAGRGELRQALTETFDPARMHRLLFLPKEPEGGGTALALPVLSVAQPHAAGYRSPGPGTAGGLVRASAPPAWQLSLAGGPSVVAIRRPGTGRLTARLVFPVALSADRSGLGQLATRSARPLSGRCPAAGGAFHRDHVTIALQGSGKDLDEILSALRCSATDLRVRKEVFTAIRDREARSLRGAAPGPMERADVELCRAGLPPGTCEGRLALEPLEKLTPADGNRWLAANLQPHRAVLVLVGDLPPDADLEAVVRGELGSWRSAPEPLADLPAPPRARRVLVVPVKEARDAWVQVAYHAPGSTDPAAERALAHHLETSLAPAHGPLAWDRIAAFTTERRGATALLVRAGLSRGSVGPLLERLEEQLRQAAAAELPAAAVDEARWRVAREHFFSRWSDEQLASALVEDQASRGAAVAEPGADIATLDAGRLRAAARRLAASPPAVVVVGDPDHLEPQLRLAGFAMEVLAEEPKASEGSAGR